MICGDRFPLFCFFWGASYISLGDERLITRINESINQFPLLLLGSMGFETQSTLGHVGYDSEIM
jgi:hypothetical protein